MQNTKSKRIRTLLLAGVLFTAGLAGLVGVWMAWPRAPHISPLATMFASLWSVIYFTAAALTWRGSRLASPALFAAVGLLLLLVSFGSILPMYLASSSP